MSPPDIRLSVLTLNCCPGYDIVGLQEVWAPQDFILVREIVKDVLPYSKHWTSGLFGSGLATFSKYPIVSSSLTRFALNGDPWPVWQGDWYDGKSCGSVVVAHPGVGEIEVFNTHYHATYDPVGTDDRYLGVRVSQAWEMSKLLRQSTGLGRRVLALGDFNSTPRSLAVALLTRLGGATDSWGSIHPLPQTIPNNLTPEQGVAHLGISCDSPLNTWTKDSKWVNEISRDPIGERLDYIFFNASSEFKCLGSDVVLQEKVPGVGGGSNVPWVNVSDHYAVHSVFSVKKVAPTAPRILLSDLQSSSPDLKDDSSIDLFEQVLSTLRQHLARAQSKSVRMMYIATPLLLLATLGLMIGSVWIDFNPRWTLLLVTMGVGFITIGWVGCFSYGFFYGGETISAFTNVIQEVQLALENNRGDSVEEGVFSLRDGPLAQSSRVQAMPAGGSIHLD
ncbi:phospholipase C type enzyme [Linnemannia hyalina]|uniref:Phospholipase C type enzyme n=1 Tax=Linnemannia hyalina TaxID=64524 RepID=A0A9P7Y2W0_9FUNG|nr:phospholipase C type enzyme [Linnemannia hyalina]